MASEESINILLQYVEVVAAEAVQQVFERVSRAG